ncbi:hypothetical protein C8A03DRAFT_33347, partial [Achaetomium macrosporum]
GGYQYQPRKAPKSFVREDDLQGAMDFVGQTDLSYRDAWMEELRKGTLDAYLAVLLLQLPRLRCLHLERVVFMESHLIGRVGRTVLCRSHSDPRTPAVSTSLNQLETVHLDRVLGLHSVKTIRNTEDVLPFFYAPSLKEISVTIDDPLGPVFPRPTDPPLAHGLASLRLAHIRESHLGPLLSIAPRLRSLHWEWRFDPDAEDQFNTPVVDLDLLMPALAHLRDTLTELSITAICSFANEAPMPPPLRVQGSTKSLAGFNQFKKLFIPLVFLTGFALPVRKKLGSCLPPNPEDLTLTDDLFFDIDDEWEEAGHTSAMRAWLADVETSTPRLRKLLLVLQSTESEIGSEDLDVRNQIRELTSRGGIELRVEQVHGVYSLRPPPWWGTGSPL